ncbi:lytic transglycosylase domain-containing protein [Pelagibius litoralis]|uniref:Lytic transglycosylase domain-containing protein n=1 Tax=Pelagibius litoralis TaxID=374515 RepID=A0A967KFW3_9PROT|nr:lytic transglycosylase domain-containing protein [Pelagibius litoralis]NIA71610.1 lytic transglycosylase domain-containing protein [Pelagibius litoralis]
MQSRSRVGALVSRARPSFAYVGRFLGAAACLRLAAAFVVAGFLGAVPGFGPGAAAQVLQPGDLQPKNPSIQSQPGGTAALPAGIVPGPDGLPAVLSPGDADRYRRVFALQEKGRWKEADKLIAGLGDRRLMGHVLAQRYLHPTAYRSRYKELKAWMDSYADHPQAQRLYKLALKRRPANYRRPQPPVSPGRGIVSGGKRVSTDYVSPRKRSKATKRKVAKLLRQVHHNVLRQRFSVTEDLLNKKSTQKLLDQVELDQARVLVASGWFYYGQSQRAYAIASAAARRSGAAAPMINWIAGLAAWRVGDLESAATFFEILGNAERAPGWNIAAGAYWAARTNLRLQRPERISPLLQRAALYPHTFYGLLARRALGMPIEFDFGSHRMDPQMAALLKNNPVGARALALMQVGDSEAAERELVKAGSWGDPRMSQALLALAQHARMPSLAFRMGSQLARQRSDQATPGALDAALYPIPPWQPENGFTVDRALIFALMRQESGFNTKAKSPDGARGLMQLMPRTASYIARDRRYRGKARNELFDPSLNMELGQRYIAYLLRHERVQGDLFRLTTAYNGGPGNLGKWARRMKAGDDPLLFIEALPSKETRLFIERVLTNLWIYRQRLGQPAPSLERLAGGDWPRYEALDGTRAEVALYGQN